MSTAAEDDYSLRTVSTRGAVAPYWRQSLGEGVVGLPEAVLIIVGDLFAPAAGRPLLAELDRTAAELRQPAP